jgi:hypothetical protein
MRERVRGPSLTSTNRVEGGEEESLGWGGVGGREGVRRKGEGGGDTRVSLSVDIGSFRHWSRALLV